MLTGWRCDQRQVAVIISILTSPFYDPYEFNNLLIFSH